MAFAWGLLTAVAIWVWRATLGELWWPEFWPTLGMLTVAAGVGRIRGVSVERPGAWSAALALLGIAAAKLIIPLLGVGAAASLAAIVIFSAWARGGFTKKFQLRRTPRPSWNVLSDWFSLGACVLPLWAWTQRFSRGTIFETAMVLGMLGFCIGGASLLVVRKGGPHLAWSPPSVATRILPLLSLLLTPALLKPTFFPYGGPWVGFALVLLVLLAPWSFAFAQRDLHKNSECPADTWRIFALSMGFALAALLLDLAGPVICLGALAAMGTVQTVWASQKNRWARIGFSVAAVAMVAGLTLLANGHGIAPGHEQVLEVYADRLDTYALVREANGKNLGVRRNFHETILDWESSALARRHTLLPLALQRGIKHLLILGGANPAGVSAALEHYVPEVTTALESPVWLPLSRWFTSVEAAKNPLTHSMRSPGGWTATLNFLKSEDRYADAVVIESQAPWRESGFAITTPAFLSRVKDRLYPDAVVVQWFDLSQWSQRRLAHAWRAFSSVFKESHGENLWLWRRDLSPDRPFVAFVAFAPSAQKKAENKKRPPLRDSLVGAPFGADALLLADSVSASEALTGVKDAPLFSAPRLLALSARDRLGWEWLGANPALDSGFVLQFLARKSAQDGPSWGGLLWTRTVLRKRDAALGDRRPETLAWPKDKQAAIEALGFNPSADYPEMSEKAAAPVQK